MTTITIRLATCQDASGVGYVQMMTWRTTYRGLVPDTFLDNLSLEQRTKRWQEALCNPQNRSFVYVAQNADGQVVGFACGGPSSTDDPEYRGELYSIYILEAYQRQGIGRQLTQAVAQRLAESNITSMLLWVLEANQSARQFYESLGGKSTRARPIEFGGVTLDEIGYGWADTQIILAS